MRMYPGHVILLALSLAFPIGAGCAREPTVVVDGGSGGAPFGGTTGGFEAVVTGVGGFVGSGPFIAPGVWIKEYGDAEDQRVSALAVNLAGEIALAGTARGTINFGNIPWEGTKTDTDVVVAKLSIDGQSLWSRRYGDSCDQRGGAVAHLPSGGVLLAGDFCGAMDFGKTTVQTKGTEIDAFVAVIDTLGEDVYSRSFGGKGAQIVRAAAADPLGNAVLVGSFDQAFDDGNGEKVTAGLDDAFVIKLDPEGALLWSATFGGPESDIPRSVALDGKGNIVIGGSFGGSVDFGGGLLTAPVGHQSGFMIELDPDGNHLWSKLLGGDADSVVNAVAVSPKGTIGAAGTFNGTADVGGGQVVSAGVDDAFLAMMDGAGDPLWGRAIGGPKNQRGTGVSFGSNDYVAVSCTSDAVIGLDEQFASIPIYMPPTNLGPSMVFAVELNAYGVPLTGWVLEGNDAMESVGVGLDPKFGVVLAGSFHKTLTSQAGPRESAGGWDVFLARQL